MFKSFVALYLSRWSEPKYSWSLRQSSILSGLCTLNGVYRATSDDVAVRRVGRLSSLEVFPKTGRRYKAKRAVERWLPCSDDSKPVSGDVDQSKLKIAAFNMATPRRSSP